MPRGFFLIGSKSHEKKKNYQGTVTLAFNHSAVCPSTLGRSPGGEDVGCACWEMLWIRAGFFPVVGSGSQVPVKNMILGSRCVKAVGCIWVAYKELLAYHQISASNCDHHLLSAVGEGPASFKMETIGGGTVWAHDPVGTAIWDYLTGLVGFWFACGLPYGSSYWSRSSCTHLVHRGSCWQPAEANLGYGTVEETWTPALISAFSCAVHSVRPQHTVLDDSVG